MEAKRAVKKRKPLWRRILNIFMLSVVTLVLLLFSTAAILITPKRLTPIAERFADALFIADIKFDTLKVSLFQDFPYVNITIVNGNVRSRAFEILPFLLQDELPPNCDSLFCFEELSVSLHLKKLFQYQVDIRRVRLRNARVNAYISPYGIANWDVWLPDTTVVNEEEVKAFQLNLQRLIIRDGFNISYQDDINALSASMKFNRLFFRGDIGAQFTDITLETLSASSIQMEGRIIDQKMVFASSIDSLRLASIQEERYALFLQSHNTIISDTQYLAELLPVDFSGELGFSLSRLDSLFFKDFTISTAQIPMLFNGDLVLAAPQPRIRLDCQLDTLPLAQAIQYLPPTLVPELHTNISAKIHASIDYPAYTIDVVTSGGYLNYPAENAYIHTLALDATYTHLPNRPHLSGIDLRRCDIEASGISLHAKGTVQNPTGDPKVDLTVQGNILLDTLYRILPLPDWVTARGAIAIDASAQFLLSDLLYGNLDATTLRGRVDAERLMLRIPKDTILMMARNTHLSFGANQNQRDTLIEQGTQIYRLSFRADSANVRYKQQFRIAMGSTRLSARSAASAFSGDTTQIHPFNGSLETTYLSLQTADSTRVSLVEGSSTFSLIPASYDHLIPIITTRLQANAFQMSDKENSYELFAPNISLRATHLRSAVESTARREARLDSLQALYPDIPRDSLNQFSRQVRLSDRLTDDFSSGDLDLEMDNDNKRLLRLWQLEGAIQADSGSVSTPYFPLPITLGNTDIEVSTEEFHLMQTEIHAGGSQIECTGRVSNLRQVLLGRGNLEVSGFIRADTLDLNELLLATNAGSQFANSGIEVVELEEAGSLLIIPANLNLDLKLFSEHTLFGNESLTDLSSSLTVRNRTLQINNFDAISSLGAINMAALYATRSKRDIKVGFDLDLKKVKVERLIALIPSIDTLAPMLRSFEGVVDCQMSATASMDTSMNILLPTLKAACRIQGQSMVLLDGETFTEISKMLYFKNKNRNLIDHIAVDFTIQDNYIKVFPFIFEMDRYRTAVSGEHKFDMSFNYHISVLNSPIPFKLGIDITGTLEKPSYKLVRCRYKDANIPSFVELINETRISLLQAIKTLDPTAAFQTVERAVLAAKVEEE